MENVEIRNIENPFAQAISGMRFIRVLIAGGIAYLLQFVSTSLPETAETLFIAGLILALDKYLRTKGIY